MFQKTIPPYFNRGDKELSYPILKLPPAFTIARHKPRIEAGAYLLKKWGKSYTYIYIYILYIRAYMKRKIGTKTLFEDNCL